MGEGVGRAVAPGKGAMSGGATTMIAVGANVGDSVVVRPGVGTGVTKEGAGVGEEVTVVTELGDGVGMVVASGKGSVAGKPTATAGVGAGVVAWK